jgi:hypothetical protein
MVRNLSGSATLIRGSGFRVMLALRVLDRSVDVREELEPTLLFERTRALRNASHRPYRISLRK